MRDKIFMGFIILVIGWLGGYLHHYFAVKGNQAPTVTDVYVLSCGEVKYHQKVDAVKERMALEILGIDTQWEVSNETK